MKALYIELVAMEISRASIIFFTKLFSKAYTQEWALKEWGSHLQSYVLYLGFIGYTLFTTRAPIALEYTPRHNLEAP